MPLYKHDCESCIYVGQYQQSDCYVCSLGTVVIRDSDEPYDYHSLPAATSTTVIKHPATVWAMQQWLSLTRRTQTWEKSANIYVYHPGTGTYMALNECYIEYVDPSIEDVEQYLDNKHATVY